MDRNMIRREMTDRDCADRLRNARCHRAFEGVRAARFVQLRRACLAGLIALTSATPLLGDDNRSSSSETSQRRVWQPRPLALPPTSDAQPAWSPPKPEPVADTPPPVTIIMTAPAPVEEPTPVRRRVASQPQTNATESIGMAPREPSRPMPVSDPINHHARTSELAQSAVGELRSAHFAARRGAFHTAKESATQTLRIIASLRDSQTGGNLHTSQLQEAITAIRESTDFTGRYGPVDEAALRRLIEVHQTPVLHNVDTSSLTAERAIESYLNYARQLWVEATAGGPLAAEATMILADLESTNTATSPNASATEARSRLHASELALMYRRAAVEIGPDNPQATADLGRSLLHRSMPAIAKELLLLSVQQKPTRQNVEDLKRAAQQSGDVQLASECEHRLATTNLPIDLPIQVLSPTDFARTNQQVATRPAARQPSPANRQPIAAPGHAFHESAHSAPQTYSAPMQSRIVDPTVPSPASRTANSRPNLFW